LARIKALHKARASRKLKKMPEKSGDSSRYPPRTGLT
jgi:hypothetical protein